MRAKVFFIPLTALVLAALACGGGSGGGNILPSPTPKPAGPQALFKDDFSDSGSGWSTGDSENSSADYENGEFVIKVKTDKLSAWSNPDQNSLSNIHIEVTARSVGKAQDAAFGIICNYQDNQNFYRLGIGSDGYYAIEKKVDGESTIFTNDENKWVSSDEIAQNADAYKLGADCGRGKLTLYVDGKQIASVSDSTYTKGDVGLFGLTFDNAGAEIRFDNFLATALK